ncbi:MAG: hypothetical protein ABH883_09485, partial [Candidatus Omnitrophota bacterium]
GRYSKFPVSPATMPVKKKAATLGAPASAKKNTPRTAQVISKAHKASEALSNSILTRAINAKDGEKILLALDKDLGKYILDAKGRKKGTADFIKGLINDLCETINDQALQEKLKNIIVISGSGVKVAAEIDRYTGTGKQGVKIDKSNVVLITRLSNRINCRSFEKNATIAYIDDSMISPMSYYPLPEIVSFTFAKSLYQRGIKYTDNALITLYKSLDIFQLPDELILDRCIKSNCVELKLKPAAEYDQDELKYIYGSIRTFLKAA